MFTDRYPFLCGVLLVALYLAGLVPFAATYAFYNPDERHYTDAALIMLRTGDYWTPRDDDGTPRFRKPALPYWGVAVGFRALGLNPLGSRIFPLLTGAGVLALTFWLGTRLGRSHAVGLLAAVILLSSPVFLTAAVRATPDIFLCLFLTLAAAGALLLFETDRFSLGAALALYVGAGLAVATKGLLGVVFIVFTWCVAFAWNRKWLRQNPRLHALALLTGSLIAASWYLLMLAAHGPSFWDSFWADQVAGKVRLNAADLVENTLLFCAFYPLFLLPWFLEVAWQRRHPAAGWLKTAMPSLRRPTRETGVWLFIVFWALALAVVFSAGSRTAPRYLLPAFPLLAVLFATALGRPLANPHPNTPLLNVFLGGAWGLLALFGVAALLSQGLINHAWLTGGVVVVTCAAALAALYTATLRRNWLDRGQALGVSLFALAFPVFTLLAPFTLPSRDMLVVQQLRDRGVRSGSTVVAVASSSLASRLRVISTDEWEVVTVARPDEIPPGATAVVWEERPGAAVSVRQGEPVRVTAGYKGVKTRPLLTALVAGRLQPYLREHTQSVCVTVFGTAGTSLPASTVGPDP
ncbi:MAG: hypothetical protein A3K19_24035 [Lentisphaerae bacterium RIFOXYB12_FULL_65_16]|nr:MAG: hypothetical protein A3K18_10250 [Lentisphaerae bacterium RIFOXYA12_64_32]OGV89587.1 MAG: hypothetical protein A3K19_24035 [Lentisphaerae bacterium RIFOXYB12_FULL_65_16]